MNEDEKWDLFDMALLFVALVLIMKVWRLW